MKLMTKMKSLLFGTKERHCHVISLYPKDPQDVDLKKILGSILDWGTQIGLEAPNWMEFDATGKRIGQPAPFKRAYENLDKLNGVKDVEAILCNQALEGIDNRFVGWRWFIALDRIRSLSIFVECAHVAEFEQHAISIISTIHRLAPIRYGFATTIPFSMGPYFYVNGTVYEGEKKQSQKNSEKLAKWNHAMIACRKNYQPIAEGYLRDIYEINILSKSHLSIEIENMALPDWVAQRSGRGQLKMLNDNLWIWSVLENDISKMQHIFGRAQLTICYGGFETQSATP